MTEKEKMLRQMMYDANYDEKIRYSVDTHKNSFPFLRNALKQSEFIKIYLMFVYSSVKCPFGYTETFGST